MTGCAVVGCDRPKKYRLWCNMHALRVKRNGEPGPVGPYASRTEHAHAAMRGRREPVETLVARAQRRQQRREHVGPHEIRLAQFLDAAHVGYRQQTQLGRYNLDFTLTDYPVAVEVVTGGGSKRTRAAWPARLQAVLAEWHLYEIRLTNTDRRWAPSVVTDLLAFAQDVAALPPGQHRIAHADGRQIRRFPSPDAVTQALALAAQGVPRLEIASRLGVSKSTVRNWIAGRHRVPGCDEPEAS